MKRSEKQFVVSQIEQKIQNNKLLLSDFSMRYILEYSFVGFSVVSFSAQLCHPIIKTRENKALLMYRVTIWVYVVTYQFCFSCTYIPNMYKFGLNSKLYSQYAGTRNIFFCNNHKILWSSFLSFNFPRCQWHWSWNKSLSHLHIAGYMYVCVTVV